MGIAAVAGSLATDFVWFTLAFHFAVVFALGDTMAGFATIADLARSAARAILRTATLSFRNETCLL
jgi:hypothetical protein